MSKPEKLPESADPVVGIVNSMSGHTEETLRLPSAEVVGMETNDAGSKLYCNRSELRLVRPESDIQDVIITKDLHPCDNYEPVDRLKSRFRKCNLPSETLVRVNKNQKRVRTCDICFCTNKWYILLVICCLISPSEAFALTVDVQEIVAFLITVFLLTVVVCLTFLVMVRQMLSTCEKVTTEVVANTPRVCEMMERVVTAGANAAVVSARYFSDSIQKSADRFFLANVFKSVLSVAANCVKQPALVVQGFSRQTTTILTAIFQIMASFTITFSLLMINDPKMRDKFFKEGKMWADKVKHMPHVEKFFQFIESLINKRWWPKDKKEKDADLNDLKESLKEVEEDLGFSQIRIETLKFTHVVTMQDFVDLKSQFEFIEKCLVSEEAEEVLMFARKNCRATDQLLLALKDCVVEKEVESFEPWPEKCGLGTVQVDNRMDWLFSSKLMKAAVRAIGKKRGFEGVKLYNFVDQTYSVLKNEWVTHVLACDQLPHKTCFTPDTKWCATVLERELIEKVQNQLGFVAWDSCPQKGNEKEIKISFVKDTAVFEEVNDSIDVGVQKPKDLDQREDQELILQGGEEPVEEIETLAGITLAEILPDKQFEEAEDEVQQVFAETGSMLETLSPDERKMLFEEKAAAAKTEEEKKLFLTLHAKLELEIKHAETMRKLKLLAVQWTEFMSKITPLLESCSNRDYILVRLSDRNLFAKKGLDDAVAMLNEIVQDVPSERKGQILNSFIEGWNNALRVGQLTEPVPRNAIEGMFVKLYKQFAQSPAFVRGLVSLAQTKGGQVLKEAGQRDKSFRRQKSKGFFGKLGASVRKMYFSTIGSLPSQNSQGKEIRTTTNLLSEDMKDYMREEEEWVDLEKPIYFNYATDAKMSTLPDKVIGRSVTVIMSVITAMCMCATAYSKFRDDQRTGWRLEAKGKNKKHKEKYGISDEEWALTQKELRQQEKEAFDTYIDRAEQYDADYHRQGRLPGVEVQGVTFKLGNLLRKVLVPISGPVLEGKTSCDNLDDVRARTFSVYDTEDCAGDHLINAYLVGKVLFSQKHSIVKDVWVVNAFKEKFHVRYEQWKDYPKSDMIYCVWNSVAARGNRVALAEPKIGTPVQMVSARLRGSARPGVIVMKTKDYAWATYESAMGDCGAPVVNNQGAVVGFHQLGTRTYANGFLAVDPAMIEFVKNNGEPKFKVELEVQGFKYFEDGRPKGICIKNKYLSPHFFEYTKENGLPMRIGNYWLAEFKPGSLEEGLRRYDTADKIHDAESLDFAHRELLIECKKHIGITNKMSVDEIHPEINLDSGPGYPWVETYKKKRELFEAQPELWKTFSERPKEVWWWAKLKCEIREIGKTARTYVASCVHFTYYANQYFLDFNQKFTEAGAKQNGFFSTVGMAVQHAGWARLKDYLAVTSKLLEGDGKRYDTRVPAEFLWRVCAMRMALYEPERNTDFLDMIWCYKQLIYSKIKTPEGYECWKMKGTPSGGVNTIVDNTCVLFMMLMYCWNRLCPDLEWRDHLRLALNGDDSLLSVSEEASSFFTPTRVAELFEQEIGMTYEVAHGGWCDWNTATYLSRYFDTKMSGIVVPRFDFTKMYSSLHFSKRPNDIAYSLVRCNGILNEMFTDIKARKLLRGYQAWLRARLTPGSDFYDAALNGFLTDWELTQLYTTVEIQGFPGDIESATPGKREIYKMDAPKLQRGNRVLKKKLEKKVGKKIVKAEKRIEKKIEKKLVARPPRPRPQAAPFRAASGLDEGLEPAMRKLAVNNANRSVVDVFNTIAMPGVGKNVRIGEEFGSRPSGVASLFNRDDTEFATSDAFTAQCFAFKSALRFQLASTTQVSYNASTNKTYGTSGGLKISQVGTTTCFPYPLVNTTGEGPHGSMVFPGRLGPSDPFYGYIGNPGDNFDFAILDAGPADKYNVTRYRFAAREWLAVDTKQTIGTGVINFAILEVGYYAFGISTPSILTGTAFSVNAAMSITCGLNIINNEPCWLQTSLPGLKENIDTISNIKFHGLSLMWTNTSNMLSKQGQIAMMQVPADTWFGYFVGYSNVSSKNLKMEANLDAQKGAYLFQKPSSVKDFEYTNEIVPANEGSSFAGLPNPLIATVQNAWFYILPELDYITIALDIPVISGVTDSRSGYWTVRTDIEYTSTDQWRSLQLPTIRKDSLEKALTLIAAAPQFHTNEFHISDLWEWVKGAAKGVANAVVEYGPTVLKVAGMVAPLLL